MVSRVKAGQWGGQQSDEISSVARDGSEKTQSGVWRVGRSSGFPYPTVMFDSAFGGVRVRESPDWWRARRSKLPEAIWNRTTRYRDAVMGDRKL